MNPVTASDLFPYVYALPETWQTILINLAGAEVAWRTPDQVAADLGWDGELTKDVLAELDVAGWLAIWDRDDGLVVTLSPWGAEQLCVSLVEVKRGRRLTPRWILGELPPAKPRPGGDDHRTERDQLANVVDPHPTPEQAYEAAEGGPIDEDVERRRPRLLLGMSLTPWPGPKRRIDRRPCAACGSLSLEMDTYCLLCDRWGRDEEILGYGGVKLQEPISPDDCVDNLGMARARRERRRASHNQRMGENRARSHSVAKARAKAQRAKWPSKPRRGGAAPAPYTKREPSAN